MVYSLKLTFVANGKNSTDIGLAPVKTIWFGSLKFTANHFSNLSLSPVGDDSHTVFVGMVHNGLPSVHTIHEESSNDGDASLGRGGLWTLRTLKVQHGDLDCPHHHHTATGERFGTSDHPDGLVVDCCTRTRYRTPPRAAASLSGGVASASLHLAD
jgi:hypothetical protein